ncbi:biotin carboxylase N-terminal domain-containing protein [Nocardioides dubius]|uniref:Acetyl-CoA carboxylase biotin carboxylase subunit n=1 Tax=Nocardioides dubius TaxID=317019 RepID=A0ABN1TU78_9ACTN
MSNEFDDYISADAFAELGTLLDSVLVANRGEIALRVFRTAAEHGIRTIALYTDLDADAPHVRAADEAVRVDSYLDIHAVVAAAVHAGAAAIHPGYGFLSERAAFARAVEAAGIRLVGPSAVVMEQMGRKDAAREIAVAAGVPVIPAYDLATPVTELDFPVLVKAAAGGGGKGMRVVRSAEEYPAALEAAAREARSAFGDDTLLIEKYVESGRHIEVQVMADTRGNVVHLLERDCSTQRRHQKVLEEAPGPTVTPKLRAKITQAAVALSRAVDYTGAGTVEFLVDNATGEPYFLEMNTRLQVEHPVTELATGDRDLVEMQLEVAAGRELEIEQHEVEAEAHAIEARVYAEDSHHGFLPQAGTARIVHWPDAATSRLMRDDAADVVRVDQALISGQVVSTAYDPMLGKVIAHGRDRETARRNLLAALDETAIFGLTTNAGFLRQLVASGEFADATIDTAWLDHHEVPAPDPALARALAAHAVADAVLGQSSGPFASDAWRASGDQAPVLVELDEPVSVVRDGTVSQVGEWRIRTLDRVRLGVGAAERLEVSVDGERQVVFVDAGPHVVEVVHRGQRFVFTRPDPFAAAGHELAEGEVTAPMPGTVLAVSTAAGQRVQAGDPLVIMEAMKMELTLKAPFDGVVAQVGAVVGDQVALGAVLVVVEPDDAEQAQDQR